MKYSGLAFQMIAVIGLAVWGGMRLDAHFAFAFPWFTVVLSVLGFVGAILGVIRSLPKGEE
ncbi:AtpZ/AtpI family protein [Catalinimonas alkaloidigena]|uniref:AtpZ/AtpI family protein n=1 Tax=Catalinimonas alkaloidigena TaxID=1075417 RepID=UPI0021CDDD2B|nr:AtpZ/AtpI family protein [Catalinimonas alkaloidigena]